jgi:acyl carrier protein
LRRAARLSKTPLIPPPPEGAGEQDQYTLTTGEACMSEVFERVKAIVIKHLEAPPEKVTDKASFIDDLGADSLDNVELVMAFEEEFGIEIPDDAAEHIQTVGDAVKFISEKQG